MTNTSKFSMVFPVYNEQENLEILFSQAKTAADSTGRQWEAIFVDDCSTDDSLAVIRGLAGRHPEVRYVAFAENRGQSVAFCAGFDCAESEIIVTMDADLQNDPADIPAMLAAFGNGCDMVVGWRAKRKDTFWKRIASRIGNKVRNWFTDDGIHDTGCSLKVMRRDMLMNVPRFKNMHRFFPILMKMQGAVINEVVVNHRERYAGVSKYGNWQRAKQGFYDLIGVRWLMTRHVSYSVREKK